MCRDVTGRINHNHDHQPKGECDARVGHYALGYVITHDGAASGKYEGERACKFNPKLLHQCLIHGQPLLNSVDHYTWTYC